MCTLCMDSVTAAVLLVVLQLIFLGYDGVCSLKTRVQYFTHSQTPTHACTHTHTQHTHIQTHTHTHTHNAIKITNLLKPSENCELLSSGTILQKTKNE